MCACVCVRAGLGLTRDYWRTHTHTHTHVGSEIRRTCREREREESDNPSPPPSISPPVCSLFPHMCVRARVLFSQLERPGIFGRELDPLSRARCEFFFFVFEEGKVWYVRRWLPES